MEVTKYKWVVLGLQELGGSEGSCETMKGFIFLQKM